MLVSQNYSQKAEFYPFEKKNNNKLKKNKTITNKAAKDMFSIYNGVVLSFEIRSSAPSLETPLSTLGTAFPLQQFELRYLHQNPSTVHSAESPPTRPPTIFKM